MKWQQVERKRQFTEGFGRKFHRILWLNGYCRGWRKMSQKWLKDFQLQWGKLSECIYLASLPNFQWHELGMQKQEWMHHGARKRKGCQESTRFENLYRKERRVNQNEAKTRCAEQPVTKQRQRRTAPEQKLGFTPQPHPHPRTMSTLRQAQPRRD